MSEDEKQLTVKEFVQMKFGLFLLTFLAMFFTTVSMTSLCFAVWWPVRADIFITMADWSTKAAVGPLVGALINSIVTPHEGARREDSREYVSADQAVHSTTVTETVAIPKMTDDKPKEGD